MATAAAPQLFQGVDKRSFGYKLLENLGWKEGDGLGAQRQGITEHVKVKKKYDAYGVGAVEKATRSRDWTTGMVGYDTILSGLKEVSNKTAKVAQPDSSESESDSDSDSEASAGAARKAAASKKRGAKSKSAGEAAGSSKKRKQASSSSSSDDSSSDSESDAEAAPGPSSAAAAAEAAARVKLATHVGRYHKREHAKRVSNYSATDLAAILGGTWSAPGEVRAAPRPSSSSSSSDEDGSSDSSSSDEEGGSAKALQPGTPPATEGSPKPPTAAGPGKQRAGADATGSQPQPEEEAGPPKWWSSMFVKAAVGVGAGASSSGRARIAVTGFSEQDQTDLYMQVHDAKTSGRVGLGRSSMPKKVAGARWQGKKTILADSEDDEDRAKQQQGEGPAEEELQDALGMEVDASKYVVTVKNGITIVMPRSKLQQPPAGEGGVETEQQQQQQKEKKKSRKEKKEKEGSQEGAEGGAAKASLQQQPAKKRKQQGTSEEQQQQLATASKQHKKSGAVDPAPAAEKAAGSDKVKWGKLAQQILANAPKRRMKLAKLREQLLSAAGEAAGGSGASHAEVTEQQLVKKLRKSSSFVMDDKYVSLADAA